MKRAKWILVLVLVLALPGNGARAQDPAPEVAFKAVHRVTLTPADEATLLAALADMNAAVAEAGHSEIRYRLYKVVGKQGGSSRRRLPL